MNDRHAIAPPTPFNGSEELADLLREELQEYGEFLTLLNEQQEAILSHDASELQRLENAIQSQIQATQQIRNQREDMVATFAQLAEMPTNTSLRELLGHFPSATQPMIQALIDEINTLIGKTRKSLKQNHMLLARASEITEQLLTALNPTGSTKTYGKSGNVTLKSSRIGACIQTSA